MIEDVLCYEHLVYMEIDNIKSVGTSVIGSEEKTQIALYIIKVLCEERNRINKYKTTKIQLRQWDIFNND